MTGSEKTGKDAEILACFGWNFPGKKVLLLERSPNFILGTEIAGCSIRFGENDYLGSPGDHCNGKEVRDNRRIGQDSLKERKLHEFWRLVK